MHYPSALPLEDNNIATLKNNIIHNKLGRSGTLGIGNGLHSAGKFGQPVAEQ